MITKNKAFSTRMNIMLGVFMVSVLGVYSGLILCLTFFSDWKGMIVSVFLALFAIPLYLIGKEYPKVRILNPIVNPIAVGFAAGTYFLVNSIKLSPLDCILILLGCAILLTSVNTLIKIIPYKKTLIILFMVFLLADIVFSIVKWKSDRTLFPLINFMSVFCFIMLAGQLAYVSIKKHMWFCLSLSYFAAFAAIIFIGVAILTEGASLEGFDFVLDLGSTGGGGGGRRAKKKKTYSK